MTYEGMEDYNAILQQMTNIWDTGGYGAFDDSMFLDQVDVVLCFAFFTFPPNVYTHFSSFLLLDFLFDC